MDEEPGSIVSRGLARPNGPHGAAGAKRSRNTQPREPSGIQPQGFVKGASLPDLKRYPADLSDQRFVHDDLLRVYLGSDNEITSLQPHPVTSYCVESSSAAYRFGLNGSMLSACAVRNTGFPDDPPYATTDMPHLAGGYHIVTFRYDDNHLLSSYQGEMAGVYSRNNLELLSIK